MTKAQRKAYKADNRQRREVEAVLARLPKPRSKTSLRKRFEAAHDEWRTAAGMEPMERKTNDRTELSARVTPTAHNNHKI